MKINIYANHKFFQQIFQLFFFFVCVVPLRAQTFPNGFQRVTVTNTLNAPTSMSFSPDGRLFVCEQGGKLKIIKNGILLNKSFISLTVDDSGERGLLGVTFDPHFTENSWVYLYFTKPDGSNNRIIRVKASGDTAIRSTMETVLDLDPLSNATNHNGGSIKFGKDGKLYIAVGENANGANSQNLNTYLGKLLRINSNGTVPSGNPYINGSKQKRSVWCYGLRNPFTFDVDPITGKIFVDDVGQSTWEEINDATLSNKNFGWPNAEGNSTNSAYTNPYYKYNHNGNASKTGCAITGGTFFSPDSTHYPEKYKGNYFYLDLCNNWINRLDLSDTSRHLFATNVGGSNVGMATGPDGNLYFISRDNSSVYKIIYTGGFELPEILEISNPVKNLAPTLYPSPAKSILHLQTNGFNIQRMSIKIFDATGALVKEIKPAYQNIDINISTLKNGYYFIIIDDTNKTNKLKFEVLH